MAACGCRGGLPLARVLAAAVANAGVGALLTSSKPSSSRPASAALLLPPGLGKERERESDTCEHDVADIKYKACGSFGKNMVDHIDLGVS